ncbi:glycosyltransferase [Mariprofundus erugo]|uniref:glycosyltransferase family 2 protein n=1 Tax=Mariprofundus erugo TaxID=2528639 RepID=UPI0010FDDEB7|nr:glycosyltransferase family 2 protein [Mariprofundus erugo]TLS78395.1 glycosyltransferase [Mariprofundus erugo]
MKISVITAVYNAKETIADAIESTLAQDYPNVELVVVDGASADGTTALLEAFRDRIDIFISEPDKGIYDALNKGIRHATGDVIGFLHADDLFVSTDVLSRVAEVFADDSVDAVYGDLVYVSKAEPDRVIRYWQSGAYSVAKLKHGWMPPHPTFYMRRQLYEKHGAFDTSFRIAADYDCMLRFLGNVEIHPVYIADVMVKMRLGGESNRSLRNIIRKSKEDYRALKKNGVGGVWALVWKNLSKLPQFVKKQ